MIISSYDPDKFERMEENINTDTPAIMSDQDDPGELKAFVEGVKGLDEENGIVVAVKAAKHKAQEIKNVMEQNGAFQILLDDSKN
jgi:hypothetical protein